MLEIFTEHVADLDWFQGGTRGAFAGVLRVPVSQDADSGPRAHRVTVMRSSCGALVCISAPEIVGLPEESHTYPRGICSFSEKSGVNAYPHGPRPRRFVSSSFLFSATVPFLPYAFHISFALLLLHSLRLRQPSRSFALAFSLPSMAPKKQKTRKASKGSSVEAELASPRMRSEESVEPIRRLLGWAGTDNG